MKDPNTDWGGRTAQRRGYFAEMARMARSYSEERKAHSRRNNIVWDKLTEGQCGWNAVSKR